MFKVIQCNDEKVDKEATVMIYNTSSETNKFNVFLLAFLSSAIKWVYAVMLWVVLNIDTVYTWSYNNHEYTL